MHETGLVLDLVHRAEAAAREAGATRVTGLTVWIGALSQMSTDHFREHFYTEASGTLAESAQLTLHASDDLQHPQAMSVMLESVDLEV